MSPEISLAVGLTVAFFLLASAASGVLDLIRRLTRSRERYMYRSLGILLDETRKPAFGSYTMELYGTKAVLNAVPPRQRALFRGTAKPRWRRRWPDPLERTARYGPVWLPPSVFAQGVQELQNKELVVDQLELLGPPTTAIIDDASDVANVKNTTLSSTTVRKELAMRFETAMQPITARYRQLTRVALFAIGLVFAASINLDAVTLARQLYLNAATECDSSSSSAPCDLPVGWPCPEEDGGSGCSIVDRLRNGVQWPAPLGWVLAAGAVSLGTPFWYAQLSKVTRQRTQADPAASSSAGSASGTGGP